MRILGIKIDCGETMCGKCPLVCKQPNGEFSCGRFLFEQDGKHRGRYLGFEGLKKPTRCQECLDAEVKL